MLIVMCSKDAAAARAGIAFAHALRRQRRRRDSEVLYLFDAYDGTGPKPDILGQCGAIPYMVVPSIPPSEAWGYRVYAAQACIVTLSASPPPNLEQEICALVARMSGPAPAVYGIEVPGILPHPSWEHPRPSGIIPIHVVERVLTMDWETLDDAAADLWGKFSDSPLVSVSVRT